jgi:hypothetical protein
MEYTDHTEKLKSRVHDHAHEAVLTVSNTRDLSFSLVSSRISAASSSHTIVFFRVFRLFRGQTYRAVLPHVALPTR